MESVNIRPAVMDDIPAIRTVGRTAWYATYGEIRPHDYIERVLLNWWSKKAIERAISNPDNLTLVAEVDGQIVGTLTGRIAPNDEGCAQLYRMYLIPGYLRRGIGRQMWECYRSAMRPDVQRIHTTIDSRSEYGYPFYQSLGFTEVERQTIDTFAHPVEEIIMCLELQPQPESSLS